MREREREPSKSETAAPSNSALTLTATAAMDLLAIKDRPDSTADLESLTVPVLVLHGEEDQLMPIDGAREMAAKILGSKFVSIAKAGHLAPMENPEEVNQAIKDFLTLGR